MSMHRKTMLCAAASTLVLSALVAEPSPVLAQSAADGDEIQEIVVTARKTKENIQNIPVAVTALTPESLAQANIKDTLDIREVTPGLYATKGQLDASSVYFTIRGQSSASGFAESSVGVYVDGVYRQSQHGLNGALVDLDRVEVLKGPQGTLYGKNTSGGVINIITQRPVLDSWGGYFTVSAGSYVSPGVHDALAERAEGAVNLPVVSQKLALRLTASYNLNDGYGRDANNRHLNNHNDPFARGQLLFKPNDNWQFLLSGDYGSFKSHGILRPLSEAHPGALATAIGVDAGFINRADIPSAANGNRPGPTFARGVAAALGILGRDLNRRNFYSENATNERYSNVNTGGASLTIDGDLWESVHLKSISAYRALKNRNANDVDGTAYHEFESSFADDSDFWSQEINLSGKLFHDDLEWLGGGFFSHYGDLRGGDPRVATQALIALNGVSTLFRSNEETNSLGFFGHGVYHLTDALSFTGGLRWSKDSRKVLPMDQILSANTATLVGCQLPGLSVANGCRAASWLHHMDSGISYEFALNYQLTPDLMPYVTTRRGFRAGDFNTNAAYRPYDPELATDYEIGLKSKWFDRRVLFNIAGYYTNYENIQKSTTVINTLPGGGISSGTLIQNAASATIKGVEAEVRYQPVRGLEFAGNYTYTNPQYDKFLELTIVPGVFNDRSHEVFEVPKHIYNLSATYTAELPSQDRVITHLGWYWQSDLLFGQTQSLFRSEKILRQNAYSLVDARITYEFNKEDLSVSVFGRNLLNKQYNTGAGALRTVGISYMMPGEPRFIGIELTKRFGS